jgi:hypothetical protein
MYTDLCTVKISLQKKNNNEKQSKQPALKRQERQPAESKAGKY